MTLQNIEEEKNILKRETIPEVPLSPKTLNKFFAFKTDDVINLEGEEDRRERIGAQVKGKHGYVNGNMKTYLAALKKFDPTGNLISSKVGNGPNRKRTILVGRKKVPSVTEKQFMPRKFPSKSKSGPPSQTYQKGDTDTLHQNKVK